MKAKATTSLLARALSTFGRKDCPDIPETPDPGTANTATASRTPGTARMFSEQFVIRIFAALLAILAVPYATAADARATYQFNLPEQSLSEALKAIGQQTTTNILFDPGSVLNKTAPALRATLTPKQAIEHVLQGTDLTAKESATDTVLVQPPKAPSVPLSTLGERVQQAGETFPLPTRANEYTRLAQAEASSGFSPSDKTSSEHPTERFESRDTIQEIIVTAQKREERLIDVPQSVSVLSSDALAKLGALQFGDFANTVPGLSFTTVGAGYTQISMRGVTTGFDIGPTVAIYVDDVPYGSSSAFADGARRTLDVNLFDVDRIEVLRGPQGTLYGASAMGGLIKYVTRQPDTADFGAELQTGIAAIQDGDTEYNIAGAVNAPVVTDKMAVRASGFYSRKGGYIDDLTLGREDIDGSEVTGGRADLLFTPTADLTVRTTMLLQDISRDGTATADYALDGTPVEGSLSQRNLFAERLDHHFRLASGTITYDFGSAMLTSISAYQTSRTQSLRDLSDLYVPLLTQFGLPYGAVGFPTETDTRKVTQEIRLAAQDARPLEWLIGGFYTRERSENLQEFLLQDVSGQPAPNILYTYSAPTRLEESAGFANLTYHPTDRFDVSGGMRYARNSQVFTQIGSGLLIGSTPPRRSSESVSTYLANARYRVTDASTAYVRYATGYRPGGPNFVVNDPGTGLPLGPETFEADRLKSYEAGFKFGSADRRLAVDLAGYYIDWQNIQVVAVNAGAGFNTNAPGGASVRGAELAITALPFRDFTVTGAFAYQDAHLSEANLDLRAAKGERLPNVPRFTAAVNADYELPRGGLRPTIGATLRYVADRTSSFDGSTSFPQYRLPAYTTVDLRVGVEFGSSILRMYVHNLTNERGQLSAFTGYSSPTGPAKVAILQPRTIGVGLTTRFGAP